MALSSHPTPLHVLYGLKDARSFRQLLDARQQSNNSSHSGAGGSSFPRSWGISSLGPVGSEVNARDGFGRTILHQAAGSLDGWALEWVRICLAQKGADVSMQDAESGWTALHRALYVGNLHAARLLMERADTDFKAKDLDDFTPWDVYNASVEGTYPDFDAVGTNLYTWGVNRNFTLGLGNGGDRTYPEPINLSRLTPASTATGSERFQSLSVQSIVMSKLHTAIVTSEPRANIRLCGFGSGGRLGAGAHTQYSFAPLKDFAHTVATLALGQDHTLALTSTGEVYSWGLGRFGQLGYVVEKEEKFAGGAGAGGDGEQVQYSPKKVFGQLKGKEVRGVAACKTASAAWTREGLYTWGTNAGQLGYDRHAVPVQLAPRKVTAISQGVLDVALAENAMCVLLDSAEVLCFWNDGHFKVNFPSQKFRNESSIYRPPQAIVKVMIAKIIACENSFSALSTFGDVFFFVLPELSHADSSGDSDKFVLRPQRIWGTRSAESMVKDIGLGADGSIILCTATGHVFIRTRNVKPAGEGRRSLPGNQAPPGPGNMKSFKFRRVPWLQRVIKVAANGTGAFGAIAVDAVPKPVTIVGRSMGEELAKGLPHLRQLAESRKVNGAEGAVSPISTGSQDTISSVDPEDEEDDSTFETAELKVASYIVEAFIQLEETKLSHVTKTGPLPTRQLWGADLSIEVAGCIIYAHQAILAARSSVLRDVLAGQAYNGSEVAFSLAKNSKVGLVKLNVKLLTRPSTVMQELQDLPLVFHPLSILLLLQYLYSDDLPSLWDRRIGELLLARYGKLKLHASRLRAELLTLARALDLPHLETFMNTATYARRTPATTLVRDLSKLFADCQRSDQKAKYDMILQLSDRSVYCHSSILRARSPFFASMFDDEEWMAERWSSDRVVDVNMNHVKWDVMEMVFAYIYEDKGVEMFDVVERETLDEFIDFVFHIMAAASELLLDKLMLICSSVILRHVNVYNVSSLLADAAHLSAKPLMDSLCGYIAMNLESMMESRLLDEMPHELLEKVGAFVRSMQADRSPVARSNILVDEAMRSHGDWLAMQDFPQPIQRSWKKMIKQSPRLSPINTMSPRVSPIVKPLTSPPATKTARFQPPPSAPDDGGIFAMDEDVEISRIPPMSLDGPTPFSSAPGTPSMSIPGKGPVWKGKSLQAHQKTDMRSIMAEEVSAARPPLTSTGSAPKGLGLPGYPPLATPARGSAKTPTPSRTPSGISISLGVPPMSTPTTPLMKPVPRPGTQRGGPSAPSAAMMSSQPQTPAAGIRQPSFKGPALGPVITPVRATPSSENSTGRRNQDAWTSFIPPAPPPLSVSPPSAGPSTGGLSFLAIQQQQKAELEAGTQVPKKLSLLEIQEQEKARQQEAKVNVEEVEFMRWWAQEEERLRREGAGPPPADGPAGARADRSRGRGRGRGGGGGRGGDTGRGGRGGRRGGPAKEKGKGPPQAAVGA